jgi:hypothetical protein
MGIKTKLGHKTFKTKKEMTTHLKKKLKEFVPDDSKTGYTYIDHNHKYFQYFKDLALRYPKDSYKSTLLSKAEAFVIRKFKTPLVIKEVDNFSLDAFAGNKKSRGLMFVNREAKEKVDSFSYIDCLSGKFKSSEQSLMDSLRFAINLDICLFRKSKNQCECCGVKNKSFEVDHVIPFNVIVKEFREICKIKEPTNFTSDSKSRKTTFHNDDVEYELEWQRYHRKRMKLQILCKSCHKYRTRLLKVFNYEEIPMSNEDQIYKMEDEFINSYKFVQH